jgi:hypothetical protein
MEVTTLTSVSFVADGSYHSSSNFHQGLRKLGNFHCLTSVSLWSMEVRPKLMKKLISIGPTEVSVFIVVQRSLRPNTKPKRPSSQYEVKKSFVKIWSQRKLCQNTKPKRPSSKYEVKESFIKIRRQRKLHQNTKSFVQPSFFRQKMKPLLKYKVKVWRVHQNTNPKKPLSKYEAKETFVEIRSQRKLHQNMKPKKALSKYEVTCEAFVFREKMKPLLKDEVKVWSVHQNMNPKKPSSKYKAKETFIKIWSQRKICQNMKPKKASSKYEVRCEASIFQRKN